MEDTSGITGMPGGRASETSASQLKEGYYIVVAGSGSEDADSDDEEVPVYDKPDGKKLKKVEIYIGEAVKVLEVKETWCRIQTQENGEGWVLATCLGSQPEVEAMDITWGKSQGPIYNSQGSPAMDEVKQGDLGDCYFLAPLAALANTPSGKKIIMAMLERASLDTFRVTFCNIAEDTNKVYFDPKETVTIDCWFPTVIDNGEYFLYCPVQLIGNRNVPIWSALMEKAYAKWDPDGYAGLNDQACSRAIAHLTGLEPMSLHWNSSSTQMAQIAWDVHTFTFEKAEDEKGGEEGSNDKTGSTKETAKSSKAEGEASSTLPNVQPKDLFQALQPYVGKTDHILIAGSLIKEKDDEKFLDEEYQIRDSHMYVILGLTDTGLILWEPKHGKLEKALPIEKLAALFDEVLMVDCSASLFLKEK